MPRRVMTGTVVSDKMNKTIIVRVERRLRHPLYKKFITRSTRLAAHDPENSCSIGDLVRIRECRPLSAHKRFEFVEKVGG